MVANGGLDLSIPIRVVHIDVIPVTCNASASAIEKPEQRGFPNELDIAVQVAEGELFGRGSIVAGTLQAEFQATTIKGCTNAVYPFNTHSV